MHKSVGNNLLRAAAMGAFCKGRRTSRKTIDREEIRTNVSCRLTICIRLHIPTPIRFHRATGKCDGGNVTLLRGAFAGGCKSPRTEAGKRLGIQAYRRNVNFAGAMFADECPFFRYNRRRSTGSQDVGADVTFLRGCLYFVIHSLRSTVA